MSLSRGYYDHLITKSLREALDHLPSTLTAESSAISGGDAIEYLSREISKRVRETLALCLTEEEGDNKLLNLSNDALSLFEQGNNAELNVLTNIRNTVEKPLPSLVVPLSQSALITNDQGLNYHALLRSELLSADQVDLICPFIGNGGISLIIDLLANLGSKLRVITTTYLGGTNQRALERLSAIGAEVKIIYERAEQKTGLHAKAWIFHRDSGFTTATVGSSNLSPRALIDGLEWNIRLARGDASQIIDELIITFERLWQDDAYEKFNPTRDKERLSEALKAQSNITSEQVRFFADLRPLPHQQDALDQLKYSRLEGKSKNLIVAATGTGKTLLAAFDYLGLATSLGGRPNLLFIAHREDILSQSRQAFQAVMRDSDFGELNVGSHKAGAWKHVFASVQSFSRERLAEIDPTQFDIVVIDEFHHAEAPTYLRVLDHFRPKQLIGLTATPERTDGRNVIDQFGTPTYELRLWHALERKLLCPFHYFGVNDNTDLRDLTWLGGKYSDSELEKRYIEHGDARADTVIRELLEKVEDQAAMKVVAFCASIRHAEYMAARFNKAGIPSFALHSALPSESRQSLVRRFRRGEFPILCTVDLFNEGIDIPEINTVLFLRPTESATIFIQQLGRGLRNHSQKGVLTVLDFVGQQHRKFRMDLRYRAMTGLSRTELEKAVKSGFPMLPPGCHIQLDRTTQERVLRNLKDAVPSDTKTLILELRRMANNGIEITLDNFLKETGLEPSELYQSNRSFNSLKLAAGIIKEGLKDSYKAGFFVHVDDKHRLKGYLNQLQGLTREPKFEKLLAFSLTSEPTLDRLDPAVRQELEELLLALNDSIGGKTLIADDLVFSLHAHYSRNEIVSIFRSNPLSMRQGTFYVEELNLDIHLVTLRKSERDFSPTTRYQDWFIARDVLHWESQSNTGGETPTGQRLINGTSRNLFFVRENKFDEGRTCPFMCIGFAHVVSHESERPIKLIWKLDQPVPDIDFGRFRNAAG